MNVETVRDIMTRLLEKSNRGKVRWTAPPDGLSSQNNWLAVFLPNSVISIQFHSPVAEPDNIELSFEDKTGRTVKSFTVYEGEDEWGLAKDLFEEARMRALGLSDILEEIQEAIMNEGPIG